MNSFKCVFPILILDICFKAASKYKTIISSNISFYPTHLHLFYFQWDCQSEYFNMATVWMHF